MARIEAPQSVGGWVSLFSTTYGPYAFGVMSLLLIWYTVVGPQLERSSLNFEKHQAVMDRLVEITSKQKDVATSMERTAIILEQAASKLGH